MKSAIRPEGIVLKYKEFMREAERDENTLITLENQLRALKLSEAKTEDPWELITTPTLLDFPTSPKLKILIFYGLIFGLFSGVSFAIYKENKSDLIYEEEELKKYFNNSNLLKINLFNFDSEKISNEILKGFLVTTNKIVFIKTNNITEGDLNSLTNYIGDINNQKNISSEFDIVDIYDKRLKDSDVNFLLIKMPNISKKEIKEITNFLNFSNIKINNLLLL